MHHALECTLKDDVCKAKVSLSVDQVEFWPLQQNSEMCVIGTHLTTKASLQAGSILVCWRCSGVVQRTFRSIQLG